MAPSLEVLKARPDGALSSPVWWEVSLPIGGGLELPDLLGPSQPKPFCASMKMRKGGQPNSCRCCTLSEVGDN